MREEIQQFRVVHVVERGHVNTERDRDTLHVQSEGLKQFDEVHLFAGERIMQTRTGMIALRPRASFQSPMGPVVM